MVRLILGVLKSILIIYSGGGERSEQLGHYRCLRARMHAVLLLFSFIRDFIRAFIVLLADHHCPLNLSRVYNYH